MLKCIAQNNNVKKYENYVVWKTLFIHKKLILNLRLVFSLFEIF